MNTETYNRTLRREPETSGTLSPKKNVTINPTSQDLHAELEIETGRTRDNEGLFFHWALICRCIIKMEMDKSKGEILYMKRSILILTV